MANPFQDMYLDGLLLPKYGALSENIDQNLARNETLNGTLNVDFFNNRRIWLIQWDVIQMSDYLLLRAKYDKQFSQQQLLQFSVESKNIVAAVLMSFQPSFSKSAQIRPYPVPIMYSGQWVGPLHVMLEEQFPIS